LQLESLVQVRTAMSGVEQNFPSTSRLTDRQACPLVASQVLSLVHERGHWAAAKQALPTEGTSQQSSPVVTSQSLSTLQSLRQVASQYPEPGGRPLPDPPLLLPQLNETNTDSKPRPRANALNLILVLLPASPLMAVRLLTV